MVVVEMILNLCLCVVNLCELVCLLYDVGVMFCVDNMFVILVVCCFLSLGVDIVMESMMKLMNGYGDVMFGCVCVFWEKGE